MMEQGPCDLVKCSKLAESPPDGADAWELNSAPIQVSIHQGVAKKRATGSKMGILPLDMFIGGGWITIRADLPGIPRENVEIRVNPNLVEIVGWPPRSGHEDGMSYFIRERHRALIQRTVFLPEPGAPQESVAVMENGVVEIKIPRKHAGPDRAATGAGEPLPLPAPLRSHGRTADGQSGGAGL